MNRIKTVALLALAALALAGCSGPKTTIDASAIDPLITNVTTRHDTYVNDDSRLTPQDKADFLRSSALLRKLQDTAMGRTPPAAPGTPR